MQCISTVSSFLHIMIRHNVDFCKNEPRFMPLIIFHLNCIILLMMKMNKKQFLFHSWKVIPLVWLWFCIHSYSNDKQAILKICFNRELTKNMNCSNNIIAYIEENYSLWEMGISLDGNVFLFNSHIQLVNFKKIS